MTTGVSNHDEGNCACLAILRMAFKELAIQSMSICTNVGRDAGPRKGSPSALAGALFELSMKGNAFYTTKIHFHLRKKSTIATPFVEGLKKVNEDLLRIAKDVDSAELQPEHRRPYWKIINFFRGRNVEDESAAEWQSVPEVAENATQELQTIAEQCNRFGDELDRLSGL